jgi:hypothetical protein
MKKAFTTVNTQLALLKEADYDISDSEGDEEASHFQIDEALQFAQVNKGFEPRIVKLFKQNMDPRSISTSGRPYCCTSSPLWISFSTRLW